MLIEDDCGPGGFLAGGTERPHHLDQPPVVAMDLEQGLAPLATAANRAFTVIGIVHGMAAASPLPTESSDLEHVSYDYDAVSGRKPRAGCYSKIGEQQGFSTGFGSINSARVRFESYRFNCHLPSRPILGGCAGFSPRLITVL